MNKATVWVFNGIFFFPFFCFLLTIVRLLETAISKHVKIEEKTNWLIDIP